MASVNAICARRNRELAAIPDAGTKLPAIAAAARRRAAIEQRALDGLQSLTPPAEIAARYRRLISLDEAALLNVVKLGERAESGDMAGVHSVAASAQSESIRLLVAAAHTGLKDCAVIR